MPALASPRQRLQKRQGQRDQLRSSAPPDLQHYLSTGGLGNELLPGGQGQAQKFLVGLEISIPATTTRRSASTLGLSQLKDTRPAKARRHCHSTPVVVAAPAATSDVAAGDDKAVSSSPPSPVGLDRSTSDSALLHTHSYHLSNQPRQQAHHAAQPSSPKLSDEERRRMFRVLAGKPPFGEGGGREQQRRNGSLQRRRSCKRLLLKGIGSQASLAGDDDSNCDSLRRSSGDGDSSDKDDGRVPVSRSFEEEGNGEVNIASAGVLRGVMRKRQEVANNTVAGRMASDARLRWEEGGNMHEMANTATPAALPTLGSNSYSSNSSSSVGNANANGVNDSHAVSLADGKGMRTCIPSTALHPAAAENNSQNNSTDNINEKNGNREEEVECNHLEEEGLAADALRHLSSVALCSLYESLRDMCDHGYAVRSRFEDIDVNRRTRPPPLPTYPRLPMQKRRSSLTTLDDEEEDEVDNNGMNLNDDDDSDDDYEGGGPSLVADVATGDTPETEHPDPCAGAGSTSTSEDEDEQDDEDEIAALEQAAREIDRLGGGGRAGPQSREIPRRRSVRWGVDEIKSDSSFSDDDEEEDEASSPRRMTESTLRIPLGQPIQLPPAPTTTAQPPPRQSILRRSSFRSASSNRSWCASSISDDDGGTRDAFDGWDERSLEGDPFGGTSRCRRRRRRVQHTHDGLRPSSDASSAGGSSCIGTVASCKNDKDDERRNSAVSLRYLSNTRSAGSVVRRLMEEVEAAATGMGDPKAEEDGLGGMILGGCIDDDEFELEMSNQSERGIISEFTRWVNESRTCTGGQRHTRTSKDPTSKRDPKLSPSSSASPPSPLLSSPLCQPPLQVPSSPYFKSGSFLGRMMECGTEIAYFGSCPVNEINYCLCAHRSARIVTVVFLGRSSSSGGIGSDDGGIIADMGAGAASSILHGCCTPPRLSEYRNPVEEDYPGRSDVVRLHEGFCAPLLRRRRRDKGRGLTKFDEISRRADALGRELCLGGAGSAGGPDSSSTGADGSGSGSSDGNVSYRVVVTGHGIGGALATAFGFFYAASSDRGLDESDKGGLGNAGAALPVQTFTYGSPRVGDAAFRSAYRQLERTGRLRHARVVVRGDIVPLLPVFSTRGRSTRAGCLFKHVGLKVIMSNNVNGSSMGSIVDTPYPMEPGWFNELRRACSDSFLLHLPAINEFGVNHSLSEHHRRLHAQVARGGLKALEKHYQTEALLSSNYQRTRRRCLYVAYLLAILLAANAFNYGNPYGILSRVSAVEGRNAASTREQQGEAVSNTAVGFDKAIHQPEMNVIESVEHEAHVEGETTNGLEESDIVAPNLIPRSERDVSAVVTKGTSANQPENLEETRKECRMPTTALSGRNADEIKKGSPTFSRNPSGLSFINRRELRPLKWGLATEPSMRQPIINSALLQEVRTRAEMKSLKVETDARCFAKSNIVPHVNPCTEYINDGCPREQANVTERSH